MPPESAALNPFDMRSSSDVFHTPTAMEKCVWTVRHRPVLFLLALLVVLSIIGALIYFTTDVFDHPQAIKYEPLQFYKLMNGDYEPHRFNGTWFSDDEILMKDVNGNIVLFNVKNLNSTVIAQKTIPVVEKCFLYELSADGQYLLLGYHFKKIYRHSFIAHYDIIDLQTGDKFTLENVDGKPWDVQLAKWSPLNHTLVVVENNDLFYVENIKNLTSTKRITKTGGEGIYNGIPDWVYEEEIFSSNSATWFSKEGNKVAYASFNDSMVPMMPLPYYGSAGNLKYQYTSIVSIHYPKVGVPNPVVGLFVENLEKLAINPKPSPIPVLPPNQLTSVSSDIILNTVIWSDDTNLFVMWMNRVQNESALVHYSINESAEIKNVVSFSQRGGWLDFTQVPLIGNENRLAVIYPVRQPDGDGFKHINVVEPDGRLVAVTDGRFEVAELLSWDVATDYIYYLANTEANPEEQYLYRTLAKAQSTPECLTCKTACKYFRAEMSTKNSYYSLTCSGPTVPEVAIFKTISGKILDWEMNTELKETLTPITLPRISFIDVPITGTGYKARVKLILPPSVDENADTKYPMLVNTYAGPGSNLALNKFSLEWNTFFSSSKNVIVAQIDGRGTGRRGDKNLFANYRKFGTHEIEDQITVASYLQDRFPFIDRSKTAIWGWSYGGYTSGMVLARDNNNVFKCGLSVAPVTDWIYYDTIYTERYMSLLTDNSANYRNASLLANAEGLRDKKYMLIHGTYDDNVHYQHSMMLSHELERRVILFRQQSYPDESHGLSSVRPHVYQTISAYLLDCFQNKV